MCGGCTVCGGEWVRVVYVGDKRRVDVGGGWRRGERRREERRREKRRGTGELLIRD